MNSLLNHRKDCQALEVNHAAAIVISDRGIGMGVAAVVRLFYPLAFRTSQDVWDRVNDKQRF